MQPKIPGRGPTREDAMNRYEVTQTPTPTKWAFIALFWLWGVGYGIYAFAAMIQAEGLSGLQAVTVAAVNMRLTAWVGGLLLFGIAAVAAPSRITVTVTDAQPGASAAADVRRSARFGRQTQTTE